MLLDAGLLVFGNEGRGFLQKTELFLTCSWFEETSEKCFCWDLLTVDGDALMSEGFSHSQEVTKN